MHNVSDTDLGIYRAMVEDNGHPKLGTSATTLGVRKGIDIDVDTNEMVKRPTFRLGQRNGVSCSATIKQLPAFVLPVEWGGSNTKTKVWSISRFDLGAQLIAIQDGASHISIGPAGAMTFANFEALVQATAPKWVKVEKC